MNSLSLSPSILIVDDNPHNLQILGNILQENNFEIEFAISGEAAIKWLQIKLFDLILLDINMPGMDGFEVCMKIRKNESLKNIPVIFLSAESDRESILKGFELGAQDYITKPFDAREMLSRIKTHLTLKKSLEDLALLNKTLEKKVEERTHQLRDANEKLESLNLKLVDLDKTKSQFLNIISHEIRTPLNGIKGPLELLKDLANTRDIKQLVEILDISVERLEHFSLDALLITQLKTKQSDIRKEKIILNEIIKEVLYEKKEKLQVKNLTVTINENANPLLIIGESELVRKCIENILDNAIFYSNQAGAIKISEYIENENVICVINDGGRGFPNGNIDYMFELFTTQGEYRDNSKGIGLPVSKMIMEIFDGNITIGNNPMGGAFVKLQFPYYKLA